MARCKFCNQEIDWITSLEGKQVPVDPDPVFVMCIVLISQGERDESLVL